MCAKNFVTSLQRETMRSCSIPCRETSSVGVRCSSLEIQSTLKRKAQGSTRGTEEEDGNELSGLRMGTTKMQPMYQDSHHAMFLNSGMQGIGERRKESTYLKDFRYIIVLADTGEFYKFAKALDKHNLLVHA
ncbi:uncharacterized protein LOC128892137 isoform X1 [Hylaeus anthracinus]|uniref:uncharacterized protein LOC128892137 isoform X1 n=1 Tax=Hylaeus anthracinus TaxID=313031 RepID=UPI0023B9A297|nr:uncharacterized protein LOC128892137 isoform X1 [Hylaeus anthracinus]